MSDLNVLFVSIDSLRRDMLGAYGTPFDWVADLDVATPNLDRFADRAITFDTHYAGSLPCMPARREWDTGIQEFLWRGWGPLEAYDTTLAEKARNAGVLTKLLTDHFHLFQHGSSGYYEDYHGFEFVRGHEDDLWKTAPYDPDPDLLRQVGYDLDGGRNESTAEVTDAAANPNHVLDAYDLQHYRPRWKYVRNVARFDDDDETDFFAAKVFSRAAEWLDANTEWAQWLLRVDEFDVHEPFHCPEPYASMYTDEDPRNPDLPVWPYYGRVDRGQAELTDRELAFVRSQFAGKVTMVDTWLGELFDALDRNDLWEETAVVITADHGFLLGEHGWVGKMSPDFDLVARTPLFVWHPDSPRLGETVEALTSAVDLHATVLELLTGNDGDAPHSRSLLPLIEGETEQHREMALYGWWHSDINVTDGTHTYMVPIQEDVPLYNYSTTQMSAQSPFTPTSGYDDPEAGAFLPYTDVPVWRQRYPSASLLREPRLYDTDADPAQSRNIIDEVPERQSELEDVLREALDEVAAPDEAYEQYGVSQ
ncbi:sulfatase-like hydrolase/transferase [Natronomonas sp. CBA1123]|uniref:sulfatase n=1 Tax=Natronomonas sp. CBA1123 TaxID=2668070 RepID=UPI0012EAE1D9|nr:sulfatase [Natronomonas sp. CBA1123]MUV85397.1 sulfatase-like hydrolase/transferase [Natronomonas sp. CBA1123]